MCEFKQKKYQRAIRGFNDLETVRPDLMLDWDWDRNTKYPWELVEGSDYKAYWICHECGHKWSCRLDSRTKNMHGCPMCARDNLYFLLREYLPCERFVLSRTVDGLNRELLNKDKNLSIVVKVNLFNPSAYNALEDLFIDRVADGMVVITDQPEFEDESKGFFYFSRVQKEEDIDENISNLANRIIKYWENLL